MIPCEETRSWNANWISAGSCHINWQVPALPAPYFRKEFSCSAQGEAVLYLCGLGYYELYLNGKKVGDRVLDPVVTQYDRRTRYVKYDLSGLLKKGKNVIGVILGDGWYNPSTADCWHFDKVSWADYPKLICELEIGGKTVLASDDSWKCLRREGPITFNALRNGEFYDARKELPGWSSAGFDDSAWENAEIIPGPGGVLTLQTMPPCKVTGTVKPVRVFPAADGGVIFDCGGACTGWARIRVKGEAGAVVKLRYSELLNADGNKIDTSNIDQLVKSGEFQTDRYTLSGKGVEEWEPRFVYHGFNFVEATVQSGKAEILELEGRLVRTAFDSVGSFECSMPELNQLHQLTRRSCEGNFTGIPTDCPHREKNGWTGDAQLACETGLFNYDLAESYAAFMQTMADSQRPSGQLPGIVPTGGWGFNWGSGPVWDAAFIVIPWNVHLYTGNRSLIEMNYEPMFRYIRYLGTLADRRHIVKFGLGDWCHCDQSRMVDACVTSTAYYFYLTTLMAKCARLLGNREDADGLSALAAGIAAAFNDAFYHGDGTYAKGEPTAGAIALEFGLCPPVERRKTAAQLAKHMETRRCRADFGIVGAKYVPRALANNGHFDTAFRVLTQPGYPGWMHWLDRGAGGLWEHWIGTASRNHIMYGDIAAWMTQFLAGIVPDEKHPGFAELSLRPFAVEGIDFVKASYRIPAGEIKIEWKKQKGSFLLKTSLPQNLKGVAHLPDGSRRDLAGGDGGFLCPL